MRVVHRADRVGDPEGLSQQWHDLRVGCVYGFLHVSERVRGRARARARSKLTKI